MSVCREWYFGLSNSRHWTKMSLSLSEVRKTEIVKTLSQARFRDVEKVVVPVLKSNRKQLKEALVSLKSLKHLVLEEKVLSIFYKTKFSFQTSETLFEIAKGRLSSRLVGTSFLRDEEKRSGT